MKDVTNEYPLREVFSAGYYKEASSVCDSPKNVCGSIGLRFTPKGDKPINQVMTFGLEGLNKPSKPINQLRLENLEGYKIKQPFRVAIGKSEWLNYEHFDEKYNLREILNDEVVIEFDSLNIEKVLKAMSQTGINLRRAGITFEYWDHGGKSPHLHIRDLPIRELHKDKRALFKKLFIKKYVPTEYLDIVDLSLTGVHLIALEWAEHWKGCYGVKKLIHVFDESEVYE